MHEAWLHRLKSATTNEESLRGSRCLQGSLQLSADLIVNRDPQSMYHWHSRIDSSEGEIEFVIKMTRNPGSISGKDDAHVEPNSVKNVFFSVTSLA